MATLVLIFFFLAIDWRLKVSSYRLDINSKYEYMYIYKRIE